MPRRSIRSKPPARRLDRASATASATARPSDRRRSSRGRIGGTVAAVFALLIACAVAWQLAPEDPDRARRRAEIAARNRDWPRALAGWRVVNASPRADAASKLGEAQTLLALGRAAQAERLLIEVCRLAADDPEPWRLRLELLHMEAREIESIRVGWQAFDAVSPARRREVLKALTLALLADEPDDLVRQTLRRWVAADPTDADAIAALYRRIAPEPRLGDPDLHDRILALRALLDADPGRVDVRETLILTLSDAGEIDRGRDLLDSWPKNARDARYDRLRGRWDLDYDDRFEDAVESYRRVLAVLPHDWKTLARLARALRRLNRVDEARAVAARVSLLRERLNPARLGRRLDKDLADLDNPQARLDLAELCGSVGLERLAEAWRGDANRRDPFAPWLSPSPRRRSRAAFAP